MIEEQSLSYSTQDTARFWYLPSKGREYLHRLDGPAAVYIDGTKYWYIENELHRLDGPAVEFGNGAKHWVIEGNQLPEKEVENWLEENNVDLTTPEGQMAYKLRWI